MNLSRSGMGISEKSFILLKVKKTFFSIIVDFIVKTTEFVFCLYYYEAGLVNRLGGVYDKACNSN